MHPCSFKTSNAIHFCDDTWMACVQEGGSKHAQGLSGTVTHGLAEVCLLTVSSGPTRSFKAAYILTCELILY